MRLYEIRGHWIDGRERMSQSGETFDVIDPGNGELVGKAARGRAADAEAAIESANRAFESRAWKNTDALERGRMLFRLAALMERDRARLAQVISLENGKPLKLANHEIDTAIRYSEYYAGWADKIGGREIPVPGSHFAYTRREAHGVIVQIIPWNYPLDILLRGTAPCLAAGNAVIVKPAEDTPFIATELARLAQEAGIPDGIFNVVLGYGAEAGAALTESPRIHGVAFCGSSGTGAKVIAATAANLVPVISLELGGKCPTLVLPDGDVEGASVTIGQGLIYNAGQSCVARSRLIVHESQVPKAIDALERTLKNVVLGHSHSNPDMGPIINARQRDRVLSYVEKGKVEGARIAIGGGRADQGELAKGFFVPPTVFVDVKNSMAIARDEIFGPVLSVLSYSTEEEGVAIANDTPFGLAGELWTRDPGRAHGTAARLNFSHITINSSGGFGVEVPFGGIGRSGFGREGGEEGLLQFTRVKSVYMSVS